MIDALASGKIASRHSPTAARTVGEAAHIALPAPLVQWQGYIIDSGAAWLKSSEILVRGMNFWNAAFVGVISMSLDDQMAARRTRLSCRSIGSRLRLEKDFASCAFSDAFARMALLARIALHLGEDACYPLQRHSSVMLETLSDRSAS